MQKNNKKFNAQAELKIVFLLSMKLRLVIFDLDGTLYNSTKSHELAMKNLFKHYKAQRKPSRKEIYAMVGEPPDSFLKWIKTFGIENDGKQILRTLGQLEIEAVKQVGKLYPNVMETLTWLKTHYFKIALCTNAPVNYWQTVLGHFNLLDYFDDVHSPTDKNHTKTFMVKSIIQKYTNLYAQVAAYMVGDRKHDIIAAKENQIPAVGALYGFGKEEVKGLADYLISDLLELQVIVSNS
ncbi:MAG: HAD family hydrolase [Bacteroidia bacterium]|nr:HAD family hydrolase [Bacteroidia bacterium]MDW8302263.1 HAD family hydrolase [Bacteroidia bacterium]